MRIESIRGSCNSYLIGNLLVDAPDGAKFPKEVSFVLLTHEHCDHISGINKLNAEICGSRFTIESITKKSENACLCKYLNMKIPEIKKFRMLTEGDKIETSEFKLEVIETPGHCKGALCFYEPEERLLFSGDTVFPDLSVPRTDLPTSDIDELIKSYEKLAKLDIEIIYPGHGREIREKKYIERIARII